MGGAGAGVLEGEAGFDAGAFVAGVGELGGGEEGLAGAVVVDEFFGVGGARFLQVFVDSVGGDDEVGFGFFEDAVEAFVEVGPWERVGGFGEAGDAFGAEPDGDDFRDVALEVEGGLEVDNELSGGGDGITEEDDTVGGEDGVPGFFDAPDVFKDGDDFGVVLDEVGSVEGVEVAF